MRTLEERIEALERTAASAKKAATFWRRLAVLLAVVILAGVGLAAAPADLITLLGKHLFIANPGGKRLPYIVEVGPDSDGGGEVIIRNAAGKQAVRVLAGKASNQLDIYDGEERLAARLTGGEKGGAIQLFAGKDRDHPVIQLPAQGGAVEEKARKP